MSDPIPQIMVVEDDSSIRESLCDLLASEGFKARGFANGLLVINELSLGFLPLVIFLDLNMPVMNGADFLKAREKLATEIRSIPVYIVTANAPAGQVRELGAAGLFRKPIDIGAMLQVAAQYCS